MADGHGVVGPILGDTIFVKLRAGQYDAVIAMYHDQGHIPVKLLGFKINPETGKWEDLSGVNITLGLPIIRTSVDHGTAFDIAGKGLVNERSLIQARRLLTSSHRRPGYKFPSCGLTERPLELRRAIGAAARTVLAETEGVQSRAPGCNFQTFIPSIQPANH